MKDSSVARTCRAVSTLFVIACLSACGASPAPARRAVATPAGYRQVSVEGVRLAVPQAWPVIDGAHARYGCSSVFLGQVDRVFVGETSFASPGCPLIRGNQPPADGVWIHTSTAGAPPPASAPEYVVPTGETVHLVRNPRFSVVTVWTHGVVIEIGIGPDPAIEQRILNSISYDPQSPNTAVLGICPKVQPDFVASRPTPTVLTSPVVMPPGSGTLRPAPGRTPKVDPMSWWRAARENQPSIPSWHVYFGVLDDAPMRPVWVILGQGTPTPYGRCSVTVIDTYDATTGASVNNEVTNG